MHLAYELIIGTIFLATIIWAVKSKDPITMGALFGGFMLFGFDWLWCSKGFWNATVASDLLMIPGLKILDQRYPISICFVWSVGFGFLPLILSKYHDKIGQALGLMHLPAALVAGALIDVMVEAVCIKIGIWTYHQAPEYLFMGVVWSNAWFLGGVLAASYFGLHKIRAWAAIPDGAGLSPFKETTWKGLLMASSAILVPAFLLGVVQLFWWSATHPWVESGRLF